MSTITPTADTRHIVDHTALAQGDLVASLETNLHGKVIEINFGGIPSQVFVQWDDRSLSSASVLRLRLLKRKGV